MVSIIVLIIAYTPVRSVALTKAFSIYYAFISEVV